MRFTFPGDEASLIFDNVNNKGGLTLDTERGIVTGFSDVKSGLSVGATRLFVYGVFDAPVTGGGKLATGVRRSRPVEPVLAPGEGRHRLSSLQARGGPHRDHADRHLPHQRRPGEGEPVPGDPGRRDLRRRQGPGAVAVGRPAGPDRGRGREPRPAHHALLQPLPAVPLPQLRFREGRFAQPTTPAPSPRRPGQDTPTHTGAKIVDGKVYVNNGFWDTYRTTWPAYSLLTPKRAGKMVDGFVQQYKDGGWISRWSSPGYADLMTGTSSDVAFADAYAQGRGLRRRGGVRRGREERHRRPADPGVGRKGMNTSPFLGYTSTDTHEGMSWALEGYLNDFGIAQMGKALYEKTKKARYKEESEYFLGRAQNYVKLFDDKAGFFQGRDAPGNWRRAVRTSTTRGSGATTTPRPTAGATPSPRRRTAGAWPTSTAAAPAWPRSSTRTSPPRRPPPRNSPARTAASSMR